MSQVPEKAHPVSIHDFKRKKQAQTKISMLTCYDYPSARIVAQTNLDCVLVGDSLAMVVHGHPSTVFATIEMMALHTSAVSRGLGNQFLVSDLPFLCHRASINDTIGHVKTLLQAGAHAIKIEGGDEDTSQTIAHLVTSGVPIMGHIGLTPQSSLQLGGFRVQGRDAQQAERLLAEAIKLEQSGCFALVLECVPSHLAKLISEQLSIPTIGIGAGSHTDGQILVWHDMLGLQTEIKPKFIKQFSEGKASFITAINHYINQVHQHQFPATEHSYH